MTPIWILAANQVSVIAFALVAGVFLTFSDFVMRALDGAKPAAGVVAMQQINRKVYRTVFMVLLLGMSAAAPLLATGAYFYVDGPAAVLIIAGCSLYFVGVFLVSLAFNIPMNQRLDRLDVAGTASAAYWTGTYLPRWTAWNHVRTATSAAAAICCLIAGMLMA